MSKQLYGYKMIQIMVFVYMHNLSYLGHVEPFYNAQLFFLKNKTPFVFFIHFLCILKSTRHFIPRIKYF